MRLRVRTMTHRLTYNVAMLALVLGVIFGVIQTFDSTVFAALADDAGVTDGALRQTATVLFVAGFALAVVADDFMTSPGGVDTGTTTYDHPWQQVAELGSGAAFVGYFVGMTPWVAFRYGGYALVAGVTLAAIAMAVGEAGDESDDQYTVPEDPTELLDDHDMEDE